MAIVTDEHRMPYRRPPLTKELLRGESTEADLPLEDEAWLGATRVDLISGRAVALDAEARSVTLSGGRRLRIPTLRDRHRRRADPPPMFRAPTIPRSAWCARLTTSASCSGA